MQIVAANLLLWFAHLETQQIINQSINQIIGISATIIVCAAFYQMTYMCCINNIIIAILIFLYVTICFNVMCDSTIIYVLPSTVYLLHMYKSFV